MTNQTMANLLMDIEHYTKVYKEHKAEMERLEYMGEKFKDDDWNIRYKKALLKGLKNASEKLKEISV